MTLLWSVVVVVLLLSVATGGAVGRNVESASVRKQSGDDIYKGDIVGGTRLSNAGIPSYYAVSVPPYGLCGAVLIHAKYLLTAAHCHTAFIHSARFVASDTVVPIRFQHVHPRYNDTSDDDDPFARFHYDLMVLELANAVTDAPILWSSDDNDHVVGSTKEVWTLGYGVNTTTNNATTVRLPSDTLQHVNLTVISIDECRAAYATIGLAERIDAARVFCTYDHDVADVDQVRRDACYGDSGSPVVAMIPNDDDKGNDDDNNIGSQHHHRLVGIVSWGRDCAGDFPAVHMKVDADFVESIVPPCDDDTAAVATATTTNSTGNNDGYYTFHYWQEHDEETEVESRCIDLTVNRMFRFWKSMNFTCGSCHHINDTASRRRQKESDDDRL
jgi:secreted trypsin-like serine protease